MCKPECGCCCTTVPMTEPPPVQGLSVRGLEKKFGSVTALDSIYEPPGREEVLLEIVAL